MPRGPRHLDQAAPGASPGAAPPPCAQSPLVTDPPVGLTRADEAGIAWAEQLLDGRAVRRQKQNRWRPQWILDVETARGVTVRALLRGFRNPGYTEMDEAGARALLAKEAAVLEALQSVPVKLPRYYGYDASSGWMLMEFVPGDTELTSIPDPQRRFLLYRQYVEELARLHAFPLASIQLPAGLERPASCRDFRRGLVDRHLAFYRQLNRAHPEPTLELGLQWCINNDVPDERPVCVGFGDVGPNQFLFEGTELRALIDIEYASVCDPLMEIGMMRARDVTYHTGRMPEHIHHYGRCYEQLTGIPLSLESLQYWTIAGPALWTVFTVAGTQRPNPHMVDAAFLFSYEVQQKRCILEGLAEKYGISLSPPPLPQGQTATLGVLHELLIGQLQQHYAPDGQDEAGADFSRYSVAIARTLAKGAGHAELDRDNRDELGALLGSPVPDLEAGLRNLERRIASAPMHDLQSRLEFLYRYEVRREHLYEPMQRASGVSVGFPLERM